jgi:Restriction endonuclease
VISYATGQYFVQRDIQSQRARQAGRAIVGKRRSDKKPRLEYVVCKPCWELKYCPYGPLVEYFPLHPEGMTRTQAMLMHRKSRAELKKARREVDVFEAVRYFLFSDPANWEWILQFDTTELECNVFGHVCPVFYIAEGFTETKDFRRTGRSIPRDVMLRVVRRDGQICQICGEPVPDDQVEFDHRIPFSRGGPATVENLRVAHRSCNRKRGDALRELLQKR